MSSVVLDCDTGRRLGCAAFCCRLIVRYGPEDEPVFNAEGLRKSCVDKDPQTGLCVHLNTSSQRCEIWERRPSVCRQFDCNHSELLQVVLAEGFVSLARLVRSQRTVPREQWQQVPYLPGNEG